MTRYIDLLDGGKTNQEGYHKPLSQLFDSGFPTFSVSSNMQVTQRGAGANMSVDVAVGSVHLITPDTLNSFWGWTDTVENVAITAANPTNPRIDTLVSYRDLAVISSVSNNNPGALNFYVAAGTPGSSPSALSDGAIQTLLGATVPFKKLAYIFVGAAVSSITTGVITDARTGIVPKFRLPGTNLVDGTVTASKLATGAASSPLVAAAESTTSTTYVDLTTVTDTVTVTVGANGILLVGISALLYNTGAGNFTFMSFAASGANTLAADDTRCVEYKTANAANDMFLGNTILLTGLAPGSTTLKAKYRVAAGTGQFINRRIWAVPL